MDVRGENDDAVSVVLAARINASAILIAGIYL